MPSMHPLPSATTRATNAAVRWASGIGLGLWLAGTAAWADEGADVQRMIRAGQLADALALADKTIAARPRDAGMRFLRGVVLTEQNKPNEAISQFLRLTEDFPELPEPYNNLAVLYAQQNQYDKARAMLEMAIRTNPSYATAYENLGDVYAKLSHQSYSKALQLDNANTAIGPKLNLIREVFTPKGRAAATPTAAPAAKPPVSTPPSAPTPPAASAPPAAVAASTPRPVASAPAAPAVAAASVAAPSADGNKAVESAVRAWAQAWAAKDMRAYLGAYGKDFDPDGGQSRAAWEEERRQRITSKRNISVGVSDLQININGNTATARFRQAYKADALDVSSRKTLTLARAGERWVIVREATGG
jgi:ketosteroid isomerase-like protein